MISKQRHINYKQGVPEHKQTARHVNVEGCLLKRGG